MARILGTIQSQGRVLSDNRPLSEKVWADISSPSKTSTRVTSSTLPEEKNYFERVGSSYAEGAKNIQEGITKSAEQVATGAEKVVTEPNIRGKLAGALDVIGGFGRSALRTVGEVAKQAFSPITELISPILNPIIEKTVESSTTIQDAIKKVSELSAQYPEYAKDISNIVDIATIGLGSAAEKPVIETTGKLAGKAATALEDGVVAQKNKFAQELISPQITKAVKESQVSRTTEKGVGVLKRSVIEPTTQEKTIAKYVAEIPDVKPTNTFQRNYNVISDYNTKEAQNLAKKIQENNFLVPRKETLAKLNVAADTLSKSPLIVGDAQKTASRLIEGAKKFISENEGTGSGVLKARKQYDEWVLSQKPKAFDATAENAFTLANREIRKTMNDMLDSKAPDLEIKESLKKQSALYSALENITPKAAEEANTAIGRFFQRAKAVIGTRNETFNTAAAALGLGGIAAGSIAFAAPAAAVGVPALFIYQGGKLLLRPEVRSALAKALREVERVGVGSKSIPIAEINKIKKLIANE